MNESEPLWPYLIFMPIEHEKRDEFVRSVLASRLARNVMSSFDKSGRVLQRDLVQELQHSNKSVLSYLKTLQKFGLSRTGSSTVNGKHVVYHELTKNGWGVARFFFEGLPSDIEELTTFLLEDYLIRLASLYRDQGIPESNLFEIFARTRAKAILDGSQTYSQPSFVLFGASAFNTEIECEKLPSSGSLASCSFPIRYPGGPTVNLALALSAAGHETTLVSSVGNDMDGWNIIANLIHGNVDVQHIIVEEGKHTNETIIIGEGSKDSRTLVGVGPTTSLSISSPSQVPWSKIETSKIVYIGEVFVEVAAAIAAHVKAQGIPSIYRCSVPYWEFGLDRLKPVLSQVSVLLVSRKSWRYLKQVLGTRPLLKLRKITESVIIIKQSKKKYLVSIHGDGESVVVSEHESPELTDSFVAGLVTKIAEGLSIQQAVEYAVNQENQTLSAR
ncbi:MAG: carbohydrate kinase family protein [Promethearchaeota archaeon]